METCPGCPSISSAGTAAVSSSWVREGAELGGERDGAQCVTAACGWSGGPSGSGCRDNHQDRDLRRNVGSGGHAGSGPGCAVWALGPSDADVARQSDRRVWKLGENVGCGGRALFPSRFHAAGSRGQAADGGGLGRERPQPQGRGGWARADCRLPRGEAGGEPDPPEPGRRLQSSACLSGRVAGGHRGGLSFPV